MAARGSPALFGAAPVNGRTLRAARQAAFPPHGGPAGDGATVKWPRREGGPTGGQGYSPPSLADLPPALVVLGGCDLLRDEGRLYAGRLRDEGVEVEEVCFPGQPHGFINFQLPAAADAFDRIGAWLRVVFARSEPRA